MEDNLFEPGHQVHELNQVLNAVKDEMAKAIVGQHELVEMLLVGLLCDGHILIEGVPGVAKTLAAKLIAKTVDADFSRIQFTPDLMPSDVIGTTVFDQKAGSFTFKRGPVFSNIILIDEINRAPAKTQAALFEVMEERQVTVDGVTHIMEYPFVILATQNPVEQEGTYRLPEAQLDRFLFKLEVHYPSLEEEVQILHGQNTANQSDLLSRVQPILSRARLRQFRDTIMNINIEPRIVQYIAQMVHETRGHASLFLGASTRASLALLKASKATAALRNRDFVIPEDVVQVAGPVLRHRIILTPEKEMEGITPDDLIHSIIQSIEVPR
ncbi:MAG TPA: MoxR family ATPase [Ferruginibacter sp.]|nr:MoxR family ATPase [Ferruginibacter sp.]HRO18161.1 MoxR family ATPase [Ferruginibacter sp.]HRQ20784.1 MoxR family ATPase [Ferruginibacter sp.]